MSEQQLIFTKEEVETYLARVRYALKDKNTKVSLQTNREVDRGRDIRFTSQFTISNIFPDEDPTDVLKREIGTLSVENYMYSLKDKRHENRSDFYVFAKIYDDFVYIKFRVELISIKGAYIFVMSFHYSDKPIDNSCFPYLR